MLTRGLLLVSLAIAGSARPSHADDSVKRARDAYDEGIALYERGEIDLAYAKLQRAVEIDGEPPEYLYNLAVVAHSKGGCPLSADLWRRLQERGLLPKRQAAIVTRRIDYCASLREKADEPKIDPPVTRPPVTVAPPTASNTLRGAPTPERRRGPARWFAYGAAATGAAALGAGGASVVFWRRTRSEAGGDDYLGADAQLSRFELARNTSVALTAATLALGGVAVYLAISSPRSNGTSAVVSVGPTGVNALVRW